MALVAIAGGDGKPGAAEGSMKIVGLIVSIELFNVCNTTVVVVTTVFNGSNFL